jgi:hypothetical protein
VHRAALYLALTACGFSTRAGEVTRDAPEVTIDAPDLAPHLQPGGGITDAPIGGLVHVFVIDNVSDQPLAGAMVELGTLRSTTDATGLSTFRDAALAGPQTVVATMPGYRAEVWVGVAGANITVPMQRTPIPAAPRATISGTIAGFAQLPVAANHVKAATIDYSDMEGAPAGANDLAANTCGASPNASCGWSLATRTGKVALLGPVLDIDTKGTGTGNDDTYTITTWAYKTGLTVVAGQDQANQVLAMVPGANLVNVTASFGTPPAGLTTVFGVAGIELGDDGTAQLGILLTPTAPALRAPPLSTFPGSTYRLTAFATATDVVSLVLLRKQLTTTLTLGGWLAPPTAISASRAAASWTGNAGSIVQAVRYQTDDANPVVELMIFDGRATVDIPASIAMPSSAMRVVGTTLEGTIDVTNFAFGNQRDWVTAAGVRSVALP